MSEVAAGIEPIQLEANGFTYSGLAAGPKDGALALFLHGWPEFATSWSEMLPKLGDAGYRAVAIDQRGYSSGARPPDISDYRIEDLVRDVLGFADGLERERFHLIGHDWGAIVGWYVASNHGDRLASYVSFATPHPVALSETRENDADQKQRSAYVDIFRAPGNVAEKALLRDDAGALCAVYEGKFAPDHVGENVRRLREPGCLTAGLNWYRAFDFANARCGVVAVPTLYGWGSKDRALGEVAALRTAGYVTGPYTFERLEGVSHWIPCEIPDRATQLVRDHLAAHPL
jgi:pimeloyl-ACP methyl ester carboxylesterase